MHELSLCDSIARAAIQNAAGRRVRSVQLRVGSLRQVVPDTLIFCWSVFPRGSLLEGSALTIDLVPAEIECGDCGRRSTLNQFVLRCPDCAGRSVTVVAGDELLIVSIEVDDEVPPSDEPDTPRATEPEERVW